MSEQDVGEDQAGKRANWEKALKKVIESFEAKLEKGEIKLTTAEYLKLAELQDQDELREIKITWVEPAKTESSNNE